MSKEPIIFYDIPAREAKQMAWSPNTWKARFALNYKGLAYKTQWVEYPDIEDVCKKIGAPAVEKKADGRPHYTLPVIYDPSTKAVVTDSVQIAKYLDKTYPDTPKLFPEGTHAFQAVFLDIIRPVVSMPLLQTLIARIADALNEPSEKYFRSTREQAWGKKLPELNTEEAWQKLEEGLERLKGYYDANGEGKDLLLAGDRVTFSDIQVASLFVWAKVIAGEDSQDWVRIKSFQGGKWVKLLEQFKAYEKVDL